MLSLIHGLRVLQTMSEQYQLLLSNGKQYPYQIIDSKRAKYIRIKLSNTGELSVVLPSRTLINSAHEFIKRKSEWVEKNLDKITITSQDYFPEDIQLQLLDEMWRVEYLMLPIENIKLIEKSNFRLQIQGKIEDSQLLKKKINKWCQNKAKAIFIFMLGKLAEEYGFHYNSLSIRSQKTRWGSCSNNKNISLNSKLLLMPEEIVQYVMIHELCHTIEMNHSFKFWALVQECDPSYRKHRKELKSLGGKILL